jgi:hypothetical protein
VVVKASSERNHSGNSDSTSCVVRSPSSVLQCARITELTSIKAPDEMVARVIGTFSVDD